MPELPEVEVIRRGLTPRVLGRLVTDAGSHPSSKFTPAVEVVGATFTAVGRRGKYLILDTDLDTELVAHLGMTGSFIPDPDDTVTHLRAWWRFDDGTRLGYRDIRRFGRLRVVPRSDYSSIPTLHHMGPEPTSDHFTPGGLRRAIAGSNRPIKTQLLSQRPVAGLGNIYADEALWLAGISPMRRRLGSARATRLHQAIGTVIAQGLAHGGTTLRDYRTTDGQPGANQHHLACYGRGGEPCRRCGTTLQVRTIDARSTTSCPSCQR
ncbi:MAG: bifunctional DNA-formamidopyrimidine glycosylase/DNA-(apurinic or apyrimidinic site) lyase [Acidimicrobiia bacterium]|nr:bifunctional DNA-formamidopyrimidine glycosylase/DNA-(apurinic or apyrimidinic site) lyase [Acidimicrobiia bacterium]